MDKNPAITMTYKYFMCFSMVAPFGSEYFVVVYDMDLFKLNMYQRLRDFSVPASILDEIFSNPEDLDVLELNWAKLESSNMTGDEIAEEVAKVIFDQLGMSRDQLMDEK
jgi:hypothetical protein